MDRHMKGAKMLQRVSDQPQAPMYVCVRLATPHSSPPVELLGSGTSPSLPQWM
jgi:hypothetical protein